MKQQTAVEWLTNELELYQNGESKLLYLDIIEKAEQMERVQIIKAHDIGYDQGYIDNGKDGEKYYNETYK